MAIAVANVSSERRQYLPCDYFDGKTQRPEPWAEKKPYAPENLAKYVQANASAAHAQTTRVARGTPCPMAPRNG